MRKTLQDLLYCKTEKNEDNFLSNAPTFPKKNFAFWKVPRIRPCVILVRATCRWRGVWSVGGMILTGGTLKYWERNIIQRGW